MTTSLLDVVDEQGRVVTQAPRDQIHRDGLLHREINVWFYTSDAKLIFQHRAPDKLSAAGLLDATVGGHVEQGSDYLQAAIQEILEETGLTVHPQDLQLIAQIRRTFRLRPDYTNNIISQAYSFGIMAKLKTSRSNAAKPSASKPGRSRSCLISRPTRPSASFSPSGATTPSVSSAIFKP